MPMPDLGAGHHRVGGVEADHFLDLGADLFGLGGGQVDLVDDGDDLMVVLDRLVDVGERLRLDPLRRVDDQQRAFARGEAAADFIGEVDVARRVHQVELIALPLEPHGLRLDRDPALFLDVHIVEHLARHLARGEPAGGLDQPVGKRRLAMVDMRDDREITDFVKVVPMSITSRKREDGRAASRARRVLSSARGTVTAPQPSLRRNRENDDGADQAARDVGAARLCGAGDRLSGARLDRACRAARRCRPARPSRRSTNLPGGGPLLAVLTVGLFGYGLYKLYTAALDLDDDGDRRQGRGQARRARRSAGSAYWVLAFLAAQAIVRRARTARPRPGRRRARAARSRTPRPQVADATGGDTLLVVIGLIILAVAATPILDRLQGQVHGRNAGRAAAGEAGRAGRLCRARDHRRDGRLFRGQGRARRRTGAQLRRCAGGGARGSPTLCSS